MPSVRIQRVTWQIVTVVFTNVVSLVGCDKNHVYPRWWLKKIQLKLQHQRSNGYLLDGRRMGGIPLAFWAVHDVKSLWC